jgi:hypothetical protein
VFKIPLPFKLVSAGHRRRNKDISFTPDGNIDIEAEFMEGGLPGEGIFRGTHLIMNSAYHGIGEGVIHFGHHRPLLGLAGDIETGGIAVQALLHPIGTGEGEGEGGVIAEPFIIKGPDGDGDSKSGFAGVITGDGDGGVVGAAFLSNLNFIGEILGNGVFDIGGDAAFPGNIDAHQG